MKTSSWSRNFLGVCVSAIGALGLVFAACSGSTSNNNTGGQGGAGPAACNGEFRVMYGPMYSAFDGLNSYKLPAIALGITGDVTWSASDPTMVDLDANGVDFGDAGPAPGKGVMITTRKAGNVTIYARTANQCGSAFLTIQAATPDEREAGNLRYNNGVVRGRDSGQDVACTNCHGDGANRLKVHHTPQQTAGYSDQDLINIFTKGEKPFGVGCRVLTCEQWHSIHQWTMTAEEQRGLLVYLRSLEPKPEGEIDFGGGMGGRGPGLGGRPGFGGRPGTGGRVGTGGAGGTGGTSTGGAGGSSTGGAGGAGGGSSSGGSSGGGQGGASGNSNAGKGGA